MLIFPDVKWDEPPGTLNVNHVAIARPVHPSREMLPQARSAALSPGPYKATKNWNRIAGALPTNSKSRFHQSTRKRHIPFRHPAGLETRTLLKCAEIFCS